MKEDILHFIWEYGLFNTVELTTTDDLSLQILNKGLKNTDSGPDFFNAKIKIGETTWAGNIEIHVNSSDWDKHHHQQDKAYDNVILHVVYENDKLIYNHLNNTIPTLELKNLINNTLLDDYNKLLYNKDWIPCATQINKVDTFIINNWLERLALERLERKSKEIEATLKSSNNDWEQTFYQYLLKYFGLKVNALPFYQLAINTPSNIFEKHNSILSIEALLFGQAGFLEGEIIGDAYYKNLQQEYKFLSAKFSLNQLDKSMWKFMRLRPANFPTIRISQIANLFSKHPRLFSKVIEAQNVSQIERLFAIEVSKYWNNHYQFDKEIEISKPKRIGKSTINNLIINVVVPFTFIYGKSKNNQNYIDNAVKLLEQAKSEQNNIIKNWNNLGIIASNAMQTQSLIELKNNYCSEKKCLNCVIGSKLLRS